MVKSRLKLDKRRRLRPATDDLQHLHVLAPAGLPTIKDLRTSVRAAVLSPEDFVPLDQAVVDGDSVVLAVDCSIPRVEEIVAGVLDGLPAGRLSAITVLVPDDCPASLEQRIAAEAGSSVKVVRHDPSDREQLAYLAAAEDAEPIYLNRALVDADFVLPIVLGAPTSLEQPDYSLGGIYPTFADRRSRSRDLRVRLEPDVASSGRERQKLAEEVAWLLGAQMLLGVVPGEDGRVAALASGTAVGVQRRLGPMLESGWRRSSHLSSDLVICSVDSAQRHIPGRPTAQALRTARQLTEPGGIIVLVLDDVTFEEPLFDMLRGDMPEHQMMERLIEVGSESAFCAAVILQCRENYRVLIHGSRDADDRIESLGLMPVSESQIERLVGQHQSPIVMNDAQYCVAGAEGD